MPAWRAQLGAAVLALGLGSTPIAAQSVNDYRLPGATSTPAPSGAQGPVDAAEPAVRQSVAAPSPSPQPSPAATQTPPARTAPSPRPVPSAAPTARPAAQVAAPVPQPQPQPSATLAAPLPQVSPSVIPPPTVQPTAPAASSTPLIPETLWPWLAAALALAAAGFAMLWWRSRKARPAVVEFERPVPAQAPSPQPAPPPIPAPPSARAIEIVLEAQRLTASLMATTLTYRLRLTNRGDQALTTLAIEGDMVSAHASLPPDQQIASPGQRLELRHAAVDLAPGASTEFSGDLRLALTAITPIRAGDGAYFVPLARLRVEASTPAGETQLTVQTFVIGELAENPGAPLRPFRLDQGPRTYARLGQRVVD